MALTLAASSEPAPERIRWEYRRLRMMTHEPDDLAALNAAGAEGWELVSVEMLYQRYFLKRRVT